MNVSAIFIGLTAGALFGLATPFSKILLEQMNSFQLAGLLYIGAALAFAPRIAVNLHCEIVSLRRATGKRSIPAIVLFGGLLGPVFILLGLKTANSSSVSVWLNMELAATAILGVLLFKDHLDRSALIGVAVSIAAGVLVTFQEGAAGLIPAAFVAAACLCWGIDNHLTALVDGASPQAITFVKGFFAGSTNLAIGFMAGGPALSLSIIIIAVGIGAASYGISTVLYVTSAQQLGATRGQVLFSTGPVWGILAAFIFLQEPVSPYVLAAILLLALGILLTNRLTHVHRHIHPALSHVHVHSHGDGHHAHSHDDVAASPAKRHAHVHSHQATEHEHPHYPDLHHRHRH